MTAAQDSLISAAGIASKSLNFDAPRRGVVPRPSRDPRRRYHDPVPLRDLREHSCACPPIRLLGGDDPFSEFAFAVFMYFLGCPLLAAVGLLVADGVSRMLGFEWRMQW